MTVVTQTQPLGLDAWYALISGEDHRLVCSIMDWVTWKRFPYIHALGSDETDSLAYPLSPRLFSHAYV